jgi:hypothetical protein
MKATLTPTSISFQGANRDVRALLARIALEHPGLTLEEYIGMCNRKSQEPRTCREPSPAPEESPRHGSERLER